MPLSLSSFAAAAIVTCSLVCIIPSTDAFWIGHHGRLESAAPSLVSPSIPWVISPTLVIESTRCTRTGAFFTLLKQMPQSNDHNLEADNRNIHLNDISRRTLLGQSIVAAAALAGSPQLTTAAVGTLPELADANAILQGITIKVADPEQQKAMLAFLENGFDCQVLRKRITGSLEETWLGFGPEQLSVPSDFTLPVSSLGKYGGHASIHLVYDAKATAPLYNAGADAERISGTDSNIAYLQLGVPSYRISQMVQTGGTILDAYAFVSVVSPAGLPIRGIVGISPDPMMFVAIRCTDVKKSQTFYEEAGFVVQEYPYCRLNKGLGQFEPEQPARSVYLAPSPNSMGVLLLQNDKRRKIMVNPVVHSLNVVYNPSPTTIDGEGMSAMKLVDPSGVAVFFQSVTAFEKEESITR